MDEGVAMGHDVEGTGVDRMDLVTLDVIDGAYILSPVLGTREAALGFRHSGLA